MVELGVLGSFMVEVEGWGDVWLRWGCWEELCD